MAIITSKPFGVTKDDKPVTIFELKNGNGMTVRMLDFGCTIQSIVVPDKNGAPVDVVLGYDDLLSYENGSCYYGATIGRYANRLGGGVYTIDGKVYQLEKNSPNGHNHIHGVFARRVFDTLIDDGTLVFKYFSPDMEEGYPGNLSVEIRYNLLEDDTLEVNYTATTDAPTIINLTNHCYFNLSGQNGSTILDHKVRLNSSAFTEYDEFFAQTGRVIPVDGTPLDLREKRSIGALFDSDYPKFRVCTGYDHNMVIDKTADELSLVGTAESDESGIRLEVLTTEPAFQFYSGNFIHFDPVEKGKNGIRYPKNGGFCMEVQHYPDSPNHPNFPTTILRPNEVYTQKTVYKFARIDK